MQILRTDIERALDEIASQEEGMRFQGLAVVLGKRRWPELIARQRKKDFGLDAYAPASLTPEKIGKGLAASITPTLKKISDDVETAKRNFTDLRMLLFVTSAKVSNTNRRKWEEEIQKDHGVELHIIEREEIITQMMLPENASLCARFLQIDVAAEMQIADLIAKTRRAAASVARAWATRIKGHPLIDLMAVRVDPNGEESDDVLSLEQIDEALSQSRRIVLEGSAGRGKTTTLIQIAQRVGAAGTSIIVELPVWISSRRAILEYIAGMPAFQVEGLTATDLARVQQAEPFRFLLNGWNEIAELNSSQANDALRELERDMPSAGIIVATRTHHMIPPLPGALRLRLLRLQPSQRAEYLASRLGEKSAELRAYIDADLSLDELTRTPFILSEVVSLFEAGVEIPSTKIRILAQVLRLQELRDEHRNALQVAPIFDRQTDYLKALATEMTRRGAVALPDSDARTACAVAIDALVCRGQIEPVGPPAVLSALTAHHVLERIDYPQTSFQFEHQQLQEYYAALDVRARLFDLRNDDLDTANRFTDDFVNNPVWTEPLRMIAEFLTERTGEEIDRSYTSTGASLVMMALAVDPIFAAELARLCGTAVWNEVRTAVGARLRAVWASHAGAFRQYATAAMLATGADDFSDVIVPLLSGDDQQTRLRTYRLRSDIHVSSLGANWREQVRGWSVEARVDFVSQLLHNHTDGEIVAFAAEDNSDAVKKAAAISLMWTRSDEALISVLKSMNVHTFEEVLRQNADHIPEALRPETIASMWKFIQNSSDQPARLRTALNLIDIGEADLDDVIKSALTALSGGDMQNLGSHYIQPALEHLRKADPAWVSEWVAKEIAEGTLHFHEYWLKFATAIPDSFVETYLHRLETEDIDNRQLNGLVAIIAARADATLSARVFRKLRDLRLSAVRESDQRPKLERQLVSQLNAVFDSLPRDLAAAGIISSVTSGDSLDINVSAELLSRNAMVDVEALRISDEDLRARLRVFLNNSVDVVLSHDDFTGEEKANLALSIAQFGKPEDMAELVRLIRADIERVRRGLSARAAGDQGAIGNGASMDYASWHIAAVLLLDSTGAERVLIDLLHEPEYRSQVAAAMVQCVTPKSEHSISRQLRYDRIWASREGQAHSSGGDLRITSFAAALNTEIRRMLEQTQSGKPAAGIKELAKALAAIDGRASSELVLKVIAEPGPWDQYLCLDAVERLLMAGVVLPATTVLALVDSIVERTDQWMQDSDRYLLRRSLALCPFVEDPAVGIAKMRDVLGKRQFRGYELRDLVTALGESRSNLAVDLLYQLASDAPTFEQCEDNFINAFAALDTPRAREWLLGFVDPDICGRALNRLPDREDLLVGRLAELAQRRVELAALLQNLCERNLPELNRHLLSLVMCQLGTPDALVANLNLIDDTEPSPVPQGIWDQLESSFIERRPYGQSSNVFTQHSLACNELRLCLFRIAIGEERRRKSAFMLLGQIEEWRLEHGRPMAESRHPDLASGQYWPPTEC